ncbi:hypothetical protein [Natronomonas sp. EA1]|uniref:hypothetical protein n=1 Tax=Natronomonas sp. EA1 TaxID=3421655 RepID=UPI003EBB64B8
MDVRDAVEADAERMAELTDAPMDVMRNLVHDRTVRIAEEDEEIVGFVSFDAQAQTVYVTQLEGPCETCTELLAEPIRFADREGMTVEYLVGEDDDAGREAAENAGFAEAGYGPRFGSTRTIRYRQ